MHVTILYLTVATLVAGQQIVMHQYHANINQISKAFKAQGMSSTELFSFFCGFVPQFTILVLDIIVLVRNRGELSKLCFIMGQIQLDLDQSKKYPILFLQRMNVSHCKRYYHE